MARYAELFALSLRLSLTLAAQYRVDFFLNAITTLVYRALTFVPLLVVFGDRAVVANWTLPEMVVVFGWFTILKRLIEGAIHPSLTVVVEHIRKGTLDFVLLKPADAQFLVSTARFEIWSSVDVVGGVALIALAFQRLNRVPELPHVFIALALLAAAAFTLYSLFVLIVCAAFYVVRLDNLSYLFQSVFDTARWPVDIFRGALRALFTYVIPLAMMTTFPAEALLGRLHTRSAFAAGGIALAFALLSRLVWRRAISRYTSASS